jgi:hypothetical protein
MSNKEHVETLSTLLGFSQLHEHERSALQAAIRALEAEDQVTAVLQRPDLLAPMFIGLWKAAKAMRYARGLTNQAAALAGLDEALAELEGNR